MSKSEVDKIPYPIGAKLIVIITMLLLLSLGAITVLVSAMVSTDVRITAEDSNFTVNRRSAAEAENFLGKVRVNVLVLLDTLNVIGPASPAAGMAEEFFFERNQDIAFICIARKVPGGFTLTRSLVNARFFLSNELEWDAAAGFLASHPEEMGRGLAGEIQILNAAPVFGVSVLALLYPWHEAGEQEAMVVFFSANALTETFSEGINNSFMVNDSGDYIIHADSDLILGGVNSHSNIVALAQRSPYHGRQILFAEDDGSRYFGAYRKIALGNAAVITTIPYDLVFEGVRATTRRNIFLTGAVLFIAVLFVGFFSKTVSEPIKALSAAALQIEGGNFELNLKPKTRDEVGFLTSSFQKMSSALGIFGRFTNKDIAVRAMRGDIKPGGLTKYATVFFSDIRGFTATSEQFTKTFGEEASNHIIFWLNDYFTRMIECVEKTNGVVDKLIGDALMAHWGTASSAGRPEDDAFNGIRAALMMRASILEMNKLHGPNDPTKPPISIGCGLNSGIVTAGQLGSEQRMEYTVIGDPVNLASRTETLNKILGTDILIAEDTWKLIGDRFITEEMPYVMVKGKEKPVRIFAVVNEKGVEGPQTLAEVREILGLGPLDIRDTTIGTEEKEFEIERIR